MKTHFLTHFCINMDVMVILRLVVDSAWAAAALSWLQVATAVDLYLFLVPCYLFLIFFSRY